MPERESSSKEQFAEWKAPETEVETVKPPQEHEPAMTALSLAEAIEMCDRLTETKPELRSKVTVLADADKIRHQQIEVLSRPDGWSITTKLTDDHRTRVLEKLEAAVQEGQLPARLRSTFKFGTTQIEAHEIVTELGTLYIATGRAKNPGMEDFAESHFAKGLVLLSIKKFPERPTSPADIQMRVSEIFGELLDIPGAERPPDAQAERVYKKGLYAWHHKLSALPFPDIWEDTESHIRREEVFPGYRTLVETDKHREYEREGRLLLFHQLTSEAPLAEILKRGFMSSVERQKRGIARHGMSSDVDLFNGGGEGVFLRMFAEGTPQAPTVRQLFGERPREGTRMIILHPRILDRLDWYVALEDRYGSRAEPFFSDERVSPEELIATVRREYQGNNELVFKNGIAVRDIKYLIVGTEARESILSELREAGITEIDGRPIEEIVISNYGEYEPK